MLLHINLSMDALLIIGAVMKSWISISIRKLTERLSSANRQLAETWPQNVSFAMFMTS